VLLLSRRPRKLLNADQISQEYALYPNERDRASYLPQCFLPLERFGLLELVDGNKEISEGIEKKIDNKYTFEPLKI
jgi:hypothetical protein